MKRTLCIILSLVMLLALAIPAAASEEASDETAAETEAAEEETADQSVPAAKMEYYESVTVGGESTGGSFYVYSPSTPHDYDLLSNCLNGVIFLYPDEAPSSISEALELVASLGLISIAEEFPAYIIIPCPMNGESWSEADVDLYWESQFYMAGGLIDADQQPPAGEYDRHTTNFLQYVIAEGSGATFFNDYLSQNAQRIAAAALFGGEISEDTPVNYAVPVYLVNADDAVVDYWKEADGTDTDDGNVSYNSSYVQKKVITAEGTDSFDAENIQTAWSDLLSRTMRLGVATNVVTSSMNQDEWVLMDWVELSDIGLNIYSFEWDAETGTAEYYTEYKTKSINSVHVYVPEAVEADPDTAVPLVVTLHGGSDDPLNIVLGCGWAQKAVDENLIILSPAEEDPDYVMGLIEYVETLYNIDTSRIYATGFSMGGQGTSNLGKAYPDVFAAITPMGSAGGSYIEDFDNDAYDLPVCMIVGGSDSLNVVENEDGTVAVQGMTPESITQAFEMNEIDPGDKDYSANPYWGYTPDEYYTITDKDLEWQISNFYRDDYVNPMVQCVILIGAAHSNADYMATIAWDFMSVYSRGADGSLMETVE